MKQPSIFLSHTSADKYFARKLGDELSRAGAKVWIDYAEIKLGDSLIHKISEGIDNCEYLGVILSPNSVVSEWVKREVEIAINKEIMGKRVVVLPLLLKNCKIPVFLTDKLYADFTTEDKFITSLNLIKEKLGLPLTPTDLTEDLVTESIIHRLRSPIHHSVAMLHEIINKNAKDKMFHTSKIGSVLYSLKRVELDLTKFRFLQAFSKGQYPLNIKKEVNVSKVILPLLSLAKYSIDGYRDIKLQYSNIYSKLNFHIDINLFEIAFMELIDNAIKYSYSNTKVLIEVIKRNDVVEIQIVNYGLSLERENMFEKGFRGKFSKMVTAEGEGLGLWLCQHIVRSHGGNLRVRSVDSSEQTVKNTFVMEFPKITY